MSPRLAALAGHPLISCFGLPAAGVCLTLALEPFAFWPLGILGVALLARALANCGARVAFRRGWLFGAGLFGSGASWVYVSIHTYGYASIPLAAFLTALFCAGLALLPAAFAACYARWVRALPGGMLLGLAALWTLFEWLRSWLLTGFPWLYLGNAFIDTWLAGWAPVLGVYGISFLAALSASCAFLAWRSRQASTLAVYLVLLLCVWGGGRWLQQVEWVAAADELPLSVALYQPNTDQARKWQPRYFRAIVDRHEQSLSASLQHDLVVWPEASIPAAKDRVGPLLSRIDRRAEARDVTLLTGIPVRPAPGIYHNSIIALGQGSGIYHKRHLVPFGEYVPLEAWLRGLIAFFDLPMSSMSPGEAEQPPLRAGNHRLAPLICYEIAYPDLTARSARSAELLVTISNDSWFGRSLGPHQHLQIARLRALENGRYLLRATNNGISAIIDHRGRVRTRAPSFVETTLVGDAQVMLGHTPFTSLGSLPILTICGAMLVLLQVLKVTAWREARGEG